MSFSHFTIGETDPGDESEKSYFKVVSMSRNAQAGRSDAARHQSLEGHLDGGLGARRALPYRARRNAARRSRCCCSIRPHITSQSINTSWLAIA